MCPFSLSFSLCLPPSSSYSLAFACVLSFVYYSRSHTLVGTHSVIHSVFLPPHAIFPDIYALPLPRHCRHFAINWMYTKFKYMYATWKLYADFYLIRFFLAFSLDFLYICLNNSIFLLFFCVLLFCWPRYYCCRWHCCCYCCCCYHRYSFSFTRKKLQWIISLSYYIRLNSIRIRFSSFFIAITIHIDVLICTKLHEKHPTNDSNKKKS